MNHYTIEELIARWRGETLTTEQMIGQMLLALQEVEQRQRAVERRLAAPPPAQSEPPAPAATPPKQRRTQRR